MAVKTIGPILVRNAAARQLAGWNHPRDLPLPNRSGPPGSTHQYFFARPPGVQRALSLLGRIALRLRVRRFALRIAGAVASQNADPRDHWELAKRLLTHESDAMPFAMRQQLQKELLRSLGIASQSRDPPVRASATETLAETLYRAGHISEALALTENGLSATPRDGRMLRVKANSLVALGRFHEGRTTYETMVALDAGNGELKRKVEVLSPLAKALPRLSTTVAGKPGASVLIGIGGGIGDMLHVTPTIHNVARRSGKRVDILVLADHSGAEFLMRNSFCVNRVWTPCPEVLDTHYAMVLLTHSFGTMRFPFKAGQIHMSRDWRTFRPGLLNETLFNLEAAKQLLGIEWENADTDGYFAGDLAYRRPAELLVGIHAGSKKERWLSKRWPHFAELTSRLAARGIRVASFGTADEYVEGTENRTGGTVGEMCGSMLDCTHFVSNDSGPMHIANALGIPVLALFAPTDPLTHLPLRRTTVALSLEKRCSPCEVKNHKYFATGRCQCVGEISVKEVEEKLMTMLRDVDTSARKEAASIAAKGIRA